MFCYQCQETVKNSGCTKNGVCGKKNDTANLQDLLIFVCKGIAVYEEKAIESAKPDLHTGRFLTRALFATITNANFDNDRITDLISEALAIKRKLAEAFCSLPAGPLPHAAVWHSDNTADFTEKAQTVGILSTPDEDIRSLRSLILFGLKGISAYAHHAAVLGYEDREIYSFIVKGLAATIKNLTADALTGLVLETGATAVKTMALLDRANTSTYGNPEITKVNIGTCSNPGILISGHDLKDMEEILKQTEGTGIDVYTHSEMLPANYYPAFRKYSHFVGNYGSSWWHQNADFESFNGPILMTTNCIIPVRDSYRDRIFTTGMAGYPGVKHIPDRTDGQTKDFSILVEVAKKCLPPKQLESGTIVGGFAHAQVSELADKIVAAVKSGSIKRFVVMAGCDGRLKERNYFTEVAQSLPHDTVILTAGCAKYRYNKLNLGDIGGIPRVLDAGQCNDSYSLAKIALKLKEVFGLNDINELPLSFDIAWYEQKAVAVLLGLLSLGVKNIRLGPTLPAFLSPNIIKVLVEKFAIKRTGNVTEDIAAIVSGR